MDIQTLTTFFMWCTIINGIIFALWAVFSIFALDFVYHTQHKWFPIPRETFNVVIYSFLGLVKVVFFFLQSRSLPGPANHRMKGARK